MSEIVPLGTHHLPADRNAPREVLIARNRAMLYRCLNLGTVVAFVGAGSSKPLGYPSWPEMVGEILDRAIQEVGESRPSPDRDGDLLWLRARRSGLGTAPASADDLLFLVGRAKKLLERHCPQADHYHGYFKDRFDRPWALRRDDPNPHRVLLDLPIERFVTSNYDLEIEHALNAVRGIGQDDLLGADARGQADPVARPRSFTQKPEFVDQLAMVALAKNEAGRNLVFHCHGSVNDPESLIATEEDYQRWYLADHGGAGPTFRQTIKLLFGSNPILFVGFGLSDEDILRPLRLFQAQTPSRPHPRPLFALLPEQTGPAGEDERFDQLYERFGIHVIPYPRSRRESDWGGDLCRALSGLKSEWLAWRDGWVNKPVLRKVVVKAEPPKAYRHYALVSQGDEVLGPRREAEDLDRLTELAQESGVVVLVGPGGMGKSWRALRLLERLDSERRFEGYFFWSSYYADDWLTGVDRFLRYAEGGTASRETRRQRLRSALKNRYLLVFDGFERMLRETEQPQNGRPYRRAVERFLGDIADVDARATVVLTSRLWPQTFDHLPNGSRTVRREDIAPLTTSDLCESAAYLKLLDAERGQGRLRPDDVSALCALLDGHAYGLLLAAKLLAAAPAAQLRPRLIELARDLSNAPPHSRLSRMIRNVVKEADHNSGGLALAFLQRLSVFMSPVTAPTLRVCYESARAELGGQAADGLSLGHLKRIMLDSRLAFDVSSGPGEADPDAFTIHPTVRGYVFKRVHRAHTDALPNFTLPGFTSGTGMVDPGRAPEAKGVLKDVFHRLVSRAEEARGDGPDGLREARELCRAAFGVLRSRAEAVTAPRWTSYSKYLEFGFRVANLARAVAPRLWRYHERHRAAENESPAAPLYAEELAWLYNDIGLALCCEGEMADTYAIWEQGYAINRVVDSEEEGGQYILQSRLHLAHTFIELGQLHVADEYLRQTERSNQILEDPDYRDRILGYQGLVAHLRGDLARADSLYGRAVSGLQAAGTNCRAQSVFQRYQSDLAITLDDLERAARLAASSEAVAIMGHYPDLVAFARKTQGHILRARAKFGDAQRAYQGALQEAVALGIRRLEADIRSELSRLALDVGDLESARVRAIEALMIANEMALGLRQTHGLVVLGLVMTRSGHRELGSAYLLHAKTLARTQGYWLRGQEAERELALLGHAEQGDATRQMLGLGS